MHLVRTIVVQTAGTSLIEVVIDLGRYVFHRVFHRICEHFELFDGSLT